MDGGSLVPDAVIANRYRLVRRLGEGAMGVVWEARHAETNEPIALKFLKGGSDDARRRFQREMRAAAAVRHANVADLHDFVTLPDGTLLMVMERLEGETLGDRLLRERTLPLGELLHIVMPLISAVGSAHALGIIHRDLKPDNIFLARSAEGAAIVKVLDFGIAKLTAAEGLAARTEGVTATGSLLGTPYYMSPEQVFSEKDIDVRADIWSLGVVMYECLAGVRPTEAEGVGRVLKRIMTAEFTPISEHVPQLPEDVARLISRMLAGDRHARPRDLGEVRAVLERYTSAVVIERPVRVPIGRARIIVATALVGLAGFGAFRVSTSEHGSSPVADTNPAAAPALPAPSVETAPPQPESSSQALPADVPVAAMAAPRPPLADARRPMPAISAVPPISSTPTPAADLARRHDSSVQGVLNGAVVDTPPF